MKKLLTFITAFIITTSTVLANHETLAPSIVTSAFETKFGKTMNVTWEKVHYVYVARFTSDDNNFEVYFSEDGELLGSARYISESWLPQSISNKIRSRFPNSNITQVLELTSETNDTSYYLSLTTDKYNWILQIWIDGETNTISKTKKQ